MSNTVNYVVVDANTIEVNYYDTNYDVFIHNKILTTIDEVIDYLSLEDIYVTKDNIDFRNC